MNSLEGHKMAQEVLDLSGEYSRMSEEMAAVLTAKTLKWAMFRTEEGCTSDKQADKKWDASEDGLKEMRLRLVMKASEKRQSALKTMLRILEGESRGSY